MSGDLKLLILKLVSNKELSGYDLMKCIMDKTGSKPSPGSMYPVLEEMKQDALISVKAVGRCKRYSITQDGKEKLDELGKQKDILMKKIKSAISVFCMITGNTETECIDILHQSCVKEKRSKH